MRVLFVSAFQENTGSAYEHRLDSLAKVLAENGVYTEKTHLILASRFLRGSGVAQIRAAWYPMPWEEFDFFHIGGSVVPAMLTLQRHRGAKIVFDCHGLVHLEKILGNPRGLERIRAPILYQIERMSARRSDLCVTVSKPLLKVLEAWRGRSQGLALIRNGVDAETFAASAAPSSGDRKHVFHVCYAGAFQSWQAVDLLVSAARELRANNHIRWRFIGFSEADQSLKQRMRRQLPDGSELIDRCDRDTLVRLLLECDLLVIPRKPYLACKVALPTKFAEFLAIGKPVLVNEVDETKDLVRQHRCGFVAQSHPKAIAEAILAAASIPPQRLIEMGQAGREFVQEELIWERIGAKYLSFLEANM